MENSLQNLLFSVLLPNFRVLPGSEYTLRALFDRVLFWLFSGKDTDLYAQIEKLESAHTLIKAG